MDDGDYSYFDSLQEGGTPSFLVLGDISIYVEMGGSDKPSRSLIIRSSVFNLEDIAEITDNLRCNRQLANFNDLASNEIILE
jgi:hypothetical protein